MSNYVVTDTQLEDVADAIRAKSGGSSPLAFPTGFVSEIGSIQTGGGEKVLTKLYEADVAEAVRSIVVPITSAIQNCKAFVFKYTDLTFSADDWFGIRINNGLLYSSTKKQNQGSNVKILYFSDSVAVSGTTLPIKPLSAAINVDTAILVTMNSDWSSIANGISTMSFETYTGNTDITAGHIEIWGWV